MSTFTDADKEAIRKYMGYPMDQQWISQVQARCAVVESIGAAQVATIQGYIRALQTLDKQLTQVTPFAAQTFSSNAGGTNQYMPGQRLDILKGEARRNVQELASSLQLTITRDIYGAAPTYNAQTMRA